MSLRSLFPFPLTDSSHALSLGRFTGREAVQDNHPDPELCHLPVEVAGHDALAEQFEAPHLCFDQTSSVIPAAAPPDGAAQAPSCADSFVPGLGARCVLQRRARILASVYHSIGAARRDGRVATPHHLR